MPYKSQAQRGYFHTKAGMKKVGAAVVAEFDAASKGKRLPKKVKKRKA
jgi:hypothetical protein